MNDDKKMIKFMGLVMGIMTIVTIMGLSFAYFTTQIEESNHDREHLSNAKWNGLEVGSVHIHSDEQRIYD